MADTSSMSRAVPVPPERNRQAWKVGMAAFLGAIALTAFGTFVGSSFEAEAPSYAILVLVIAVATIAILTFVVTRSLRIGGARRVARSGLITGLIGVLSVWAYWSGLPVIFGAAGVLLGDEARRAAAPGEPGRRMAGAAMVLGVLAILGGLLASISDKLAT